MGMFRFCRAVAFWFIGMVSFLGCTEVPKGASTAGLKIGELAPMVSSADPNTGLLKSISFNLYIFEVPAANVRDINDLWPLLHSQTLSFCDFDSFRGNCFLAGFGQFGDFQPVNDLLTGAGASRQETVTLLLADRKLDDISVALLRDEQTVWYVSAGGMEGASIGPGRMGLRVKAEPLPGLRGVCSLQLMPIFMPRNVAARQIVPDEKYSAFVFTSAGLSTKISPGQFVVLAADKYINNQSTLAGVLCSRPKPLPVARVFVIMCTAIIE